MATESSGFNPVPALVHVVAIAVGILLGLLVMDRISPDLPDAGIGPGVSSSSAPRSVDGDDPDSLFRVSNLGPALAELDQQLAAGEGIRRLRIEPGSLSADSVSGDGLFSLGDVPAGAPALIVAQAHADRDRVTLADISSFELVATTNGPRWYVQIDNARSDVPPPWTYGAPLAGTPIEIGGAPPQPIGD